MGSLERWVRASTCAEKADLAAFQQREAQEADRDPARRPTGRAATDTGRKLSTPTIYIPAVGTPYPISITKRGLEHGEITFADWNYETAPTPRRTPCG